MKKHLLAGILSLVCAGAVHAESRDWHSSLTESRHEFHESQLDLPPFPNPNEGDWFNLYINETHSGSVAIWLSSVQIAPDKSVRYVLNQRSSKGYDNLSAEGLLCMTGHQLWGSDGAKIKTFGYGDLANQRWITPRRSDWTTIGSKMNSTDKIRGVLHQLLCVDGLPKTDAELRQRIQKHGGRIDRERDTSRKNDRD